MKKTIFLMPVFLLLLVSFASAALTDGVIHAWNADELSGQLNDSLQTSNLTPTNSPDYYQNASCIQEGCVLTTGTQAAGDSDYFSTTLPGLSDGDDWTLSYWATAKSYTDGHWSGAPYVGPTNLNYVAFQTQGVGVNNYNLVVNGVAKGTFAVTEAMSHYVIISKESGTDYVFIYKDGSLVKNDTVSGTHDNMRLSIGAFDLAAGSNNKVVPDVYDEIVMWDRVLTNAEITELYNGGAGEFYPFTEPAPPQINNTIEFDSQVPADITSQTPFIIQNVTIIYNYTNVTNITQPYQLNFTIVTETGDCIHYQNGTCEKINATWEIKNQTTNATTIGGALINFTLNENDIFPITENTRTTTTNGNITQINLSGSNDFFKEEFINLTELKINYTLIYEPPLNNTGVTRIYYGNNGYTEGDKILTSPNVTEVCTFIDATTFNHTHQRGLYGHQLCYINVLNGEIGGLPVTKTSYFFVRAETGSFRLEAINYSIRSGSAKTTANGGSTWTESTNQLGHLHFFTANDYLRYQAFGTQNEILINSSLSSQDFFTPQTPPQAPEITNPLGDSDSNATLNITYEAAIPTVGSSIGSYNITLLNRDFSINTTIIGNNSVNTSYLWRVFDFNLETGLYFIRVEAVDNNGFTNFDIEGVNITKTSIINITALYAYDNSTINSFNINVSYKDGTNGIYSTTAGFVPMDSIPGENHTIKITATNFSSNTTIFQSTGFIDNLTFSLYAFNSLNIFFFDENTMILINTTEVFLDLLGDTFSKNYSTGNGTLIADLLTPENYQARYYAAGYVERFYYFTVLNDSFQILNLYLSNDTDQILVKVRDIAINPIEGAVVKAQKFIPAENDFITIEVGTTDFNGEIVMSLSKNDEFYRFIVTVNGDTRLTTIKAYIIQDTITLTLPGEGATGEELFEYLRIDSSISFNNITNLFTFTFNDPNNVQRLYCLYIDEVGGLNFNVSCTTNDAGTLTTKIIPTNGTGYHAQGIVFIGEEIELTQMTVNFTDDPSLGRLGLLIQFVITTIFIIITLKVPEFIPLSAGISLVLGKAVNLTQFDWSVVMAIAFAGLIISIWLGRKRSS